MNEKTGSTPEKRLVPLDIDERVAKREAIEKAGRYERGTRHVYLAMILAALGLIFLAVNFVARLFQ